RQIYFEVVGGPDEESPQVIIGKCSGNRLRTLNRPAPFAGKMELKMKSRFVISYNEGLAGRGDRPADMPEINAIAGGKLVNKAATAIFLKSMRTFQQALLSSRPNKTC